MSYLRISLRIDAACRALKICIYLMNRSVYIIATDTRVIKLGIKLMICDGEERKYQVLVGAPVIVKEKKSLNENTAYFNFG